MDLTQFWEGPFLFIENYKKLSCPFYIPNKKISVMASIAVNAKIRYLFMVNLLSE